MTQEKIIQEYTDYLDKQEYTSKTKRSYRSNLRAYLEKNGITSKQELITQLQNSYKTSQTSRLYKWLHIQPKAKKTAIYLDPLLVQFQQERKIADSTMQGYQSSILRYTEVCGFHSCKEMIQEAVEDEKKHIPTKETRLATHLKDYLRHLNENIKSNNTIHTYFTKLETFYRHYGITVPQRQAMTMRKDYHVSYYDLPDKQMIQTAINQSDKMIASMIYFMSSSGTAKNETLSVTVGKFIEGLRDYTDKTDPKEVVYELKERRDLVPVIALVRKKTDIPYFTCCSPEATYHILQYMMSEQKYNREEKLWNINGSYVMKKFQQLNDHNGWGFVGPYRRFRTHTLRKFHASNLGCSFDVINTLEGRTNGTIHETYVKQKPDQLKKVYMEHMHNVMINTKDYIGPHLGGEREEEKIKNSLVELVPDLVPTLELVSQVQQQQVQQVVQPQGLQQAPFDYNILKDIARLETRMDAIEKRLEKLGG